MKIIVVKVFQLKQLKRRNLKKISLEFPFKPEFFQVSSFQLLKLKHLHCDDLHIILPKGHCCRQGFALPEKFHTA